MVDKNREHEMDDLLQRSGNRNVSAPRLLSEAIELRFEQQEDLLADLFDPRVESILPHLEIV